MLDLANGRPNEADARRTQYCAVAALALAMGFAPALAKPNSKTVTTRKWQMRSLVELKVVLNEIERYPNAGMAIVCGHCCAIDIDIEDPALADQMHDDVMKIVPGEPLVRFGQWPRRILLYRSDGNVPTRHGNKVDILGNGSYFIAYGIHPKTGQPYWWANGSPVDRHLADLPLITVGHIEAILELRSGKPSLSDTVPGKPNTPGSDLVKDGRDVVMRDMVWRRFSLGERDAKHITDVVWEEFSAKVDLTRPKRDGQAPWSRADVADKVAYLLNSGKSPPTQTGRLDLKRDLVDSPLRAFAGAINSIGAAGHLSPADVRISHCMLELCLTGLGCFLSVEEIARRLDYAVSSVKRSRGKLVALGLWHRTVQGGGRGNLAFLVPRPIETCAFAEKVSKIAIRSSSRVGVDADTWSFDSLKKEKEKNIELFQSLISSPEELRHG